MPCTTDSLASAISAASRARSTQSSQSFFDLPPTFTVLRLSLSSPHPLHTAIVRLLSSVVYRDSGPVRYPRAMDPWSPRDAWSLLSPDAEARVEMPRWMHAARTFLDAELSSLEGGEGGEILIGVAPARAVAKVTVVRVRTMLVSEAPEVLAAAHAGVRAIGGAGMDALVAKAKRVWQVGRAVEGAGDARAPLVLAAALATVMLAPVVPPDEVTIFGVRGARVRLEKMG